MDAEKKKGGRMKKLRQFLVCESAKHADVVDKFILWDLEDKGCRGNAWSGVYVRVNDDGTETFAVLWAPPVSLFGQPEDDPQLVIATEVFDADGVSDWQDLPQPEVEPSDLGAM